MTTEQRLNVIIGWIKSCVTIDQLVNMHDFVTNEREEYIELMAILKINERIREIKYSLK